MERDERPKKKRVEFAMFRNGPQLLRMDQLDPFPTQVRTDDPNKAPRSRRASTEEPPPDGPDSRTAA